MHRRKYVDIDLTQRHREHKDNWTQIKKDLQDFFCYFTKT